MAKITPMTRKAHKMWTKDEFKTILSLWETESTADIAYALGRPVHSVTGMASLLRKMGAPIPKKHRPNYLSNLVVEFVQDIKKKGKK